MRIAGRVAAVMAAAIMVGAVPAASAQDDRPERARQRAEEMQRRREALRARQEELRRARQEMRRGPMASEAFTAVAKLGRQGTLPKWTPLPPA